MEKHISCVELNFAWGLSCCKEIRDSLQWALERYKLYICFRAFPQLSVPGQTQNCISWLPAHLEWGSILLHWQDISWTLQENEQKEWPPIGVWRKITHRISGLPRTAEKMPYRELREVSLPFLERYLHGPNVTHALEPNQSLH